MRPNYIQKLLYSRETINKMKSKPTEWGKIFGNIVTEKGLFKVCKVMWLNKKEKKKPNQKMDRIPKQTFHQRRYTDDKQAYKKTCNNTVTNRKIKTKIRLSPHTSQNDHHQKVYKQEVPKRVWRERNSPILLMGI